MLSVTNRLVKLLGKSLHSQRLQKGDFMKCKDEPGVEIQLGSLPAEDAENEWEAGDGGRGWLGM